MLVGTPSSQPQNSLCQSKQHTDAKKWKHLQKTHALVYKNNVKLGGENVKMFWLTHFLILYYICLRCLKTLFWPSWNDQDRKCCLHLIPTLVRQIKSRSLEVSSFLLPWHWSCLMPHSMPTKKSISLPSSYNNTKKSSVLICHSFKQFNAIKMRFSGHMVVKKGAWVSTLQWRKCSLKWASLKTNSFMPFVRPLLKPAALLILYTDL